MAQRNNRTQMYQCIGFIVLMILVVAFINRKAPHTVMLYEVDHHNVNANQNIHTDLALQSNNKINTLTSHNNIEHDTQQESINTNNGNNNDNIKPYTNKNTKDIPSPKLTENSDNIKYNTHKKSINSNNDNNIKPHTNRNKKNVPSQNHESLSTNSHKSNVISSKFELWYNDWIHKNPHIKKEKSLLINSGTHHDVKNTFDCSVRFFAWNYGKFIQPSHGLNKHLFDALQLAACNITINTPNIFPTSNNPHIDNYHTINHNAHSVDCIFYISPISGDDSNDGSLNSPFYTIKRGIIATRKFKKKSKKKQSAIIKCFLELMEGTFYLDDTILLTEKDNFLTFRNYQQHKVVISGGIKLKFDGDWKLEDHQKPKWVKHAHSNNIYNRIARGSLRYLGRADSFKKCLQSAYKSNRKRKVIYSITWFDSQYKSHDGRFHATECYGVPDIAWSPSLENNVHSGHLQGRYIWSIKILNSDKLLDGMIYGLRNNKTRCIRARYPNQNPEISMQFDALSGWIAQTEKKPTQKKWILEHDAGYYNATRIVIDASDYPDIDWPMHNPTNTKHTSKLWRKKLNGHGDAGQFVVGKGGPCANYEPDFGYWCAQNSPRSHRQFISQHKFPTGMRMKQEHIFVPNLQNGKYTNDTLQDAIIHVWHPKHWFTWMFDIKSFDNDDKIITFNRGGFQGGEGEYWGGEYYIENVFDELDSPNEYFYNKSTNILYMFHNHTQFKYDIFVATNLKVLFNITSLSDIYVQNITFNGIEFGDTSYTYMDIHGLPSGGDWSINKQAAIIIHKSKNILISNCTFIRLDGHAIFLLGYNRNIIIEYNKFEWIGESCICLWGETTGFDNILPGGGPDGRNGTQPRFTLIQYNQFREIGIFQKQSSALFQAQSCHTIFKYNIFVNGPRAAININDGFGGNNVIFGNLILNTCRESGDHGPFNAWDRIPYITNIRNGSSSIIPAFNKIYNNLWIGTYQTQETVDTDDGVSYYNITNNFFIYGQSALKGDFGGHNIYHTNNIYAYVEDEWTFCCNAGANDIFINNELILLNDNGYDTCTLPIGGENIKVYNNNVYLPTKTANTLFVCNQKIGNSYIHMENKPIKFVEWQKKGYDKHTTINRYPSDIQIIKMGIDKLLSCYLYNICNS